MASCCATAPRRPTTAVSGGEGTFLVCSFWMADALSMIGRRDEAQELFERLLAMRNDLGLLAEEYDPVAKRQLGNFPQAFSHVGIVNSANNLAVARRPGRAARRARTRCRRRIGRERPAHEALAGLARSRAAGRRRGRRRGGCGW